MDTYLGAGTLHKRKWLVGWILLVGMMVVMGLIVVPVEAASQFRNIGSYTSHGSDAMVMPLGIAIDDNGKVYISDANLKRIFIFNEDGSANSSIVVNNPGAIAIKGNTLYVVSDATDIFKFNLNNHQQIGERIMLQPEVANPAYGIAVDSQGNIYASVIDKVVKVDTNENISVFKSELSRATGIAIDEQDHIYLITDHRYIHKWDKHGASLGKWDHYDEASDKNGLAYYEGHLYVTTNLPMRRGFIKLSAENGQNIEAYTEENPINYYTAADIAVHPSSKDIYVVYRRGTQPTGFWIYRDMGTTTSVTISPTEIYMGESVTISASVTANDGKSTPTGEVEMKDGNTTLGTVTLVDGQASISVNELLVGDRSITAVYKGDGTFAGSSSEAVIVTVNKLPSSTSLNSSSLSIDVGESVTLTATVSNAGTGSETPSGLVTFINGDMVIGTAPLAGGTATITLDDLPAGVHSIVAEYDGDSSFEASSDSIVQTVNKVSTKMTLITNKAHTVYGESVTFTITVDPANSAADTPTGTVMFRNGLTELETIQLNAGEASLQVDNLAVGTHEISVAYSGDDKFQAGNSHGILQIVDKAITSTQVSSSKTTSVFGEEITLTATVTAIAPGKGTPTGNVTFKNEAGVLGTATLNEGIASLDLSDLGVGVYTITAEYSGDSSFNDSSSTVEQTVGQANTTTQIHSSKPSSMYGETVTFTVAVSANAPGSGVPTGTVTLKDGEGESLGTATLSGGSASFNISDLVVGDHTLAAEYIGDVSFTGSSGTVVQKVEHADSMTTVATSNAEIKYGESITLIATVSSAGAVSKIPTGTVTFKRDGQTLGDGTLDGDGKASIVVDRLAVGDSPITAHYSGDEFYTESSGTVNQSVDRADTMMSLSASKGPSVYGEQVIFTATVTAVGIADETPTGSVTFSNGAVEIDTVTLDGDGVATLELSDLVVGSHSITATYNGADFYEPNSDDVVHEVNPADTTVDISSSQTTSVFGEEITLTATVTAVAPGEGTPTGTVTFKNEDGELGTATLSDGTASIDVSNLAVGIYTMTAEYSGDISFSASAGTYEQTVTKADTSTIIHTSKANSELGEEITLTATVSAIAPGVGTPTGAVVFMNGMEELATVALSGGIASHNVSDLFVGEHTITAVYSGDGSFEASSGSVDQQVMRTDSTTSVTTSQATSVFGERITLTVTVNSSVSNLATPTGTVTLMSGSEQIGSVDLIGGTATYDTSTLTAGIHTITAQYMGDGSFTPSSGTVQQTVDKANTSTDIVVSKKDRVYGESIDIDVNVVAVHPGNGIPTGIVELRSGSEVIQSATLEDGEASFTLNEWPVDTHMITVAYAGDDGFNGSADQTTITVVQAQTTIDLASAKTETNAGEDITLVAKVYVQSPGSGIPTGKVTFMEQDEVLGEVTLALSDEGVAELLISGGLESGRYEIYAHYEGDDRFIKSDSETIEITVLTVRRPSSSRPAPIAPTSPVDSEPVISSDGKINIPAGKSGSVSLGESITVTIPEGMSDEEVQITIEEIAEVAEWINDDDVLLSGIHEILSNLTGTFKKEITISIVFDPTQLGPNQRASIFYFDEEKREWIEVSGIVEGNVISVTIDHLTKFAVFAVSEPTSPFTFSDIEGHWAAPNIEKASDIVTGYPDGTFRPNHPVTRAEFTVMLMNALKLDIQPEELTFTDEHLIGSWARQAISQAVQAGIIRGYEDGSFLPNKLISRTEMTVMIANAMDLDTHSTSKTSFTDDEEIPGWAKGAVEAVRNLGIVQGRSNNVFVPNDHATRAESLMIILNMLEHK